MVFQRFSDQCRLFATSARHCIAGLLLLLASLPVANNTAQADLPFYDPLGCALAGGYYLLFFDDGISEGQCVSDSTEPDWIDGLIWLPDVTPVTPRPLPPTSGASNFDPVLDDIGRDDPSASHGQISCGNPIDLGTGNKYQREVDFVGEGQFPLTITRHYNSLGNPNINLYFGKRWALGGYSRLEVPTHTAPVAGASERLQIIRGTGQVVELYRTTTESWRRLNGAREILAVAENDGKWMHTEGEVTSVYTAEGALVVRKHVSGEWHEYEYDSSGRLSRIVHNYAGDLTFAYGAGDRISTITDSAGNVYDYDYDTYQNLVSVEYPDGSGGTDIRQYDYGSTSQLYALTRITDERGIAFAEWTYDTSGRATASYHAGNTERLDVSYLAGGVTRTTNALGKITDYTSSVTADKHRVGAVNGLQNGTCLAANQSYTYDAKGYYDTVTDWSGNVTDYNYNDYGQMLSVTRGSGSPVAHQTTYEWDEVHLDLPTKITTPTLITEIEYIGTGLVKSIKQTNRGPYGTVGEQRETRFGYIFNTSNGAITKRVVNGPRTDVSDLTTYNYDSNGRPTSIVNALGHTTTFSNYDALSRVGRITFPSGLVRDIEYHPRGWITASTDIVNGVSRRTEMTYDEVGQLTGIEYADGSTLSFTYTDAGYLDAIYKTSIGSLFSSTQHMMEFDYDVAGNVVREAVAMVTRSMIFPPPPPPPPGQDPSPAFQITTTTHMERDYIYDALSRLTEAKGGVNQSTRYWYDKSNRVTDVFDPLNRRTRLSYDALDRLDEIIDPASQTAGYEYDNDYAIDLVEDKKGNDTTFQTDGFGQTRQRISPDTGTTTYTYDSAGNVKTMTDARGKLTTYTYDALNRRTHADFADGSSYVYTYDSNRAGYLYRVTDSSGTTTFNRNHAGEVTSKVAVVSGTTMTTTLYRDVMGRVERITYPGGTNVYYTFDVNGDVSRVEVQHTSFSRRNLASNITYKPFGPMTSLTYGNGEALSRSYDNDYRLTALSSGTVVNRNYSYNATNTISSIIDSATSQNRTYSYDTLDRLSSYGGPGGTHAFQYDANDNRTRKTVSGAITHFNNASTSNRLNTLSGALSQSRSYDANGNTTSIGAEVLTYSDANRLAAYRPTAGGTQTSYTYNGLGERVYKSRSGFNQRFVFGGGARLLHERGSQGTKDYIYLNGELIAFVYNNTVHYVHNDHLATPQVVTTTASNIRWRATAKPFGDASISPSAVTLNVRYPGQYFDSESGLHYNYFRYYEPDSGRYVTSDPIGLAGGLNTYAYAGSNPIGSIDPLGLFRHSGTDNPLIFNLDDWNATEGACSSSQSVNRARMLNTRFGSYVRDPNRTYRQEASSSRVSRDVLDGNEAPHALGNIWFDLPRDSVQTTAEIVASFPVLLAVGYAAGPTAAGPSIAAAGKAASEAVKAGGQAANRNKKVLCLLTLGLVHCDKDGRWSPDNTMVTDQQRKQLIRETIENTPKPK